MLFQNRAKIQVKRRLPSRKARQEALRTLASDEHENVSSKTATACEDNSRVGDGSMITSPSTDEEDMFGVPPLETKVSSSPTDIFSEPSVVSPGLSSLFTRAIKHSDFVPADDSIVDIKHTGSLGFRHESVSSRTSRDTLIDSLSSVVRVDFDDKLFESNLKGINQSNDSSEVHYISTEDIISDSKLTKSYVPTESELLGAENSGNVLTTVSENKNEPPCTVKSKNPTPKVSHDFFDDDSVTESLFFTNLENKPKSKPLNKKSLFDDENEGDDIFCSSAAASSSRTTDTIQKKSSESGKSI